MISQEFPLFNILIFSLLYYNFTQSPFLSEQLNSKVTKNHQFTPLLELCILVVALWYSRTSISGGARDGEHSDTSPFPGYTCAKRQNISEYFAKTSEIILHRPKVGILDRHLQQATPVVDANFHHCLNSPFPKINL